MTRAEEWAGSLARSRRTVLLGGMAVIQHGMSRVTQDIDLWCDPGASPDEWANWLLSWMQGEPDATLGRLPDETAISSPELARVVAEDRLVRLLGADQPLDLFRVPNEMEPEDFAMVWERASPQKGRDWRLIEEIDLIVTKARTNRERDLADTLYLEDKIERSARAKIGTWHAEEARKFFERFQSPLLARLAATEALDPDVKLLGRELLATLAAEGDPFATEFLDSLPPA